MHFARDGLAALFTVLAFSGQALSAPASDIAVRAEPLIPQFELNYKNERRDVEEDDDAGLAPEKREPSGSYALTGDKFGDGPVINLGGGSKGTKGSGSHHRGH